MADLETGFYLAYPDNPGIEPDVLVFGQRPATGAYVLQDAFGKRYSKERLVKEEPLSDEEVESHIAADKLRVAFVDFGLARVVASKAIPCLP